MYRHFSAISLAPAAFLNQNGIHLGKSVGGRDVRLDPTLLERHLIILGKTGTGKSNLLQQIIHHVIEVEGSSVILFDPHGTLAKAASAINPGNSVVISPRGLTSEQGNLYFSLNAISVSGNKDMNHIAVGWIKEVFASEGVFSHGTWGPRLEVVFSSILQEMMKRNVETTLGDLLDMLLDRTKTKNFVEATENERLKAFLKMQMADWRGWNQYITSSLNKLMPLLTHDGIRNLVSGREDSISLTGEMEQKPTLLIPEIWKDTVPDDTYKIITVLLLLKVWLEKISAGPQALSRPIYLVFDEAQTVPESVLDRLLREGRKFGLRVIMATQFMDRDSLRLSDTVMGNVSNVICFSLSERGAREISANFFSGKPQSKIEEVLKSQSTHWAVVWSQQSEGISGPLSFNPSYEQMELDEDIFAELRNTSLLRLGKTETYPESREQSTDLHEFIIKEFQKYLVSKDIESSRNESIGGIIPDLIFFFHDTRVFVEVEVSDLLKMSRILEKLHNYAGRYLVFLTPPGASMKLMADLLEGVMRKDRTLHSSLTTKTPHLLSRVSIVEFDGNFQFLAAGRLRRMKLEHLLIGSFIKTVQELPLSEVRSYLLSAIMENDSFTIQFPVEKVRKVFGEDNCAKALSKLTKNSGLITLKDIFMDNRDDKPAD